MAVTRRKKKPTAKQLVARRKFAAMARSRAKAARRKNRVVKRTVTRKKTVVVANKRNPLSQAEIDKRKATSRKRTRRNPAADQSVIDRFEAFSGRQYNESNTEIMEAPASAPSELALIGDLIQIKTDLNTFDFASEDEYHLATDKHGKLFIVGGYGETFEASANAGEIYEITYGARKPHIEPGYMHYYHKFGDEGGAKPTLKTDSDGRLLIVGGDYTIEPEGITNAGRRRSKRPASKKRKPSTKSSAKKGAGQRRNPWYAAKASRKGQAARKVAKHKRGAKKRAASKRVKRAAFIKSGLHKV